MSERMESDRTELALVSEPLDVLERVLEDSRTCLVGFVLLLGVHEHDDGIVDLVGDLIIGSVVECLRERLPGKPARLKGEELHAGILARTGRGTTPGAPSLRSFTSATNLLVCVLSSR